jgi:hypothetical protein
VSCRQSPRTTITRSGRNRLRAGHRKIKEALAELYAFNLPRDLTHSAVIHGKFRPNVLRRGCSRGDPRKARGAYKSKAWSEVFGLSLDSRLSLANMSNDADQSAFGKELRPSSGYGASGFNTTHWSAVLLAGQGDSLQAAAALEQLLPHLLVSPLRLRSSPGAQPARWTGPDSAILCGVSAKELLRFG